MFRGFAFSSKMYNLIPIFAGVYQINIFEATFIVVELFSRCPIINILDSFSQKQKMLSE